MECRSDLAKAEAEIASQKAEYATYADEKAEAARYLSELLAKLEQTAKERDALANLTARSRVERDKYLSDVWIGRRSIVFLMVSFRLIERTFCYPNWLKE